MRNLIKKFGLSLLVIGFGIFLIFLVGNWQLEKIKKSLPQNLQKELKVFPMEEIQKKFFGETTELKEWVSPDGKLKISFLSDWMEIEKEAVESLNQEIIQQGAKILFFAQKLKIKGGAFGSLVIQELDKKEWTDLEKIIEETKKEFKEKNGEIEIVRINSKEGVFEAKYKKEGQPELHFVEKILIGEDRVYSVLFLTFDKDWQGFLEETNSILNSAKILQ